MTMEEQRNEKDTAATARIEYLTYEQYEEKFEELYRHISWDAVDLSFFDSYYEGAKEKRGTASVDEDILEMIGNPPYVLCQPATTEKSLIEYYKKYEVASYKIDLFHLFFEKAICLLKEKGLLGFITPNTYLTNKYIKPLRKHLLLHCDIAKLVMHKKVFNSASVDVATIILNKSKIKGHSVIVEEENVEKGFDFYSSIKQQAWEKDNDFIFNIHKSKSIEFHDTVQLGSIFNTYFGIQAYNRDASIFFEKDDKNYLPIIDGEDIFPYMYATPKKFFDYKKENIKSGGDWNVYSNERIVIRQIGIIPVFGLCKAGILGSNTLYNLWSKTEDFSLLYVLCILNSKLIKYFWRNTYYDNKALFPKIKGYQLKELPIKAIPLTEQKPLIQLANQMLEAHNQLEDAKFENDKKFLEQRIKLLDSKINSIVYALYGLSEEEIKIEEG